MYKDTAFILSRSHFDDAATSELLVLQRVQMNGQTDRQKAFQLYIID